MSMARSQRSRRLRLAGVGAEIAIAALVASTISVSIAEAATCLASAEEVRKATPNAWPKWTFGPNRERCWYAGKKPVFEKPQNARAEAQPADAPPARSETALEAEGSSTAMPVERPWVLEYRWRDAFGMRHQANDESLEPWVGDPDVDSRIPGRLLPASQ